MKYGYKTPSINVKVEGINIPKLSTDEKTTIDIAIGDGTFEVEGSATELIEFGCSVISEVKSFTTWLFDFMEQVEKRQDSKLSEMIKDIKDAASNVGGDNTEE